MEVVLKIRLGVLQTLFNTFQRGTLQDRRDTSDDVAVVVVVVAVVVFVVVVCGSAPEIFSCRSSASGFIVNIDEKV